MTPVFILIGTMSGTAEMAAEEMSDVLARDARFSPKAIRMEKVDASVFDRPGLFIICTSSYGEGDPPDNAKALFDQLSSERPDLTGVRYGVFGLGDRQHALTFGFGSQKFDELLSSLGADRMVDRDLHDLRSGRYPEEQAVEWLNGWMAAAHV